jgi:hypothetical protein
MELRAAILLDGKWRRLDHVSLEKAKSDDVSVKWPAGWFIAGFSSARSSASDSDGAWTSLIAGLHDGLI